MGGKEKGCTCYPEHAGRDRVHVSMGSKCKGPVAGKVRNMTERERGSEGRSLDFSLMSPWEDKHGPTDTRQESSWSSLGRKSLQWSW